MTIARKFTLALLGCVTVAVTVYAMVAVHEELGRTESDIEEYEASTAHALRPAIRDVWSHDGEQRALELIGEAQQRLGNVDIRCVSLDPSAPPAKRPRVDLSGLSALAGGQDVVVVDRAYEHVGRIFTYVRVNVDAAAPVAIEVSRSLGGHGDVRRAVVRNAALTALAVAAISALVTTLLGLALIERPLGALVTQARRVGEGDLSYRIATRRHDEIAVVAREMNRMCDRLRELQESERAQAEAKTQALAQLRHADRLATVGRLAAGLAHELGTPLNVVHARAKQLTAPASRHPSQEEVRERARIIVEQVDRMTKLIRQLLDFARKREMKPTETDLGPLVSGVVALLDPIARKRSVSLQVTGNVSPVACLVDPEQMTQVLLNLVMNAVHASASGQTVTLSLGRGRAVPPPEDGRPEQGCARVEVRDEGAGIPSDALPRIFEPFYTTKDVGEGTGLGLSVAYGIVKDHGGWIDVVSRAGEGSVFTVWLPERGRA
jgi:signal transduction histidine kinase